jgi:small-conductance mechanosensitive channel
MYDLTTAQDYYDAFLSFLERIFMTKDMVWNLLCLGFLAVIAYFAIKMPSKQVYHSLQLKLLPTRFARLAPRIQEIAFLAIFAILLWVFTPILHSLNLRVVILTISRNLVTAILVIRLALLTLPNTLLLAFIILLAGIITILEVLGLLQSTITMLDQIYIFIGETRISALKLIDATIVVIIAYFILALVKDQIGRLIKRSSTLDPAQKALTQKFISIGLIVVIVLIGLAALGINLTAVAVFTGAIGFGIGIGLQRIFLNLLSGFIILFDRSIKPGDVITVGSTFGWVNSIHARYISVITREGKEYLIPNEKFISDPVENWTYSSDAVRIRVPVPVSDSSDIAKAAQILLDIAKRHPRILKKPEPRALLIGIGDSAVNFELRVWIQDPAKGLVNVRSDLLFKILKKFRQQNIELPSPQRKLVITHEGEEHELLD